MRLRITTTKTITTTTTKDTIITTTSPTTLFTPSLRQRFGRPAAMLKSLQAEKMAFGGSGVSTTSPRSLTKNSNTKWEERSNHCWSPPTFCFVALKGFPNHFQKSPLEWSMLGTWPARTIRHSSFTCNH